MTTKSTNLHAGDRIHWLRSGILHRTFTIFAVPSAVSQRGEELVVTDEILAASLDRDGRNSWLNLTDEQQVQRWGSLVYGRGPAPEGMTAWTPGTTEEQEAYGAARSAAWAQGDPERRAEALADLRRDFGSPKTSRTLRTESGSY